MNNEYNSYDNHLTSKFHNSQILSSTQSYNNHKISGRMNSKNDYIGNKKLKLLYKKIFSLIRKTKDNLFIFAVSITKLMMFPLKMINLI